MTDIRQQLRTFPADSPLQRLADPFPEPVPIRLFLKRDDRLHPLVSGNKWRKLKYNLVAAAEQQDDTLLTFGGAYSNHLYATAAAGKVFGFRTIGIVRGEELARAPRNPTLAFCESCGMRLHFVSRTEYRRKDDPDYLAELRQRFGRVYILPEGGTNDLAVRGAAELMPEIIAQLGAVPDVVCCPVGTGGTVAGLAASAPPGVSVLGFLALKASDFRLPGSASSAANVHLVTPYHFGGYARTTPVLLDFMDAFERKTKVRVEPIYTAKMLYGIYDLTRQGYFSNGATVVAVHTGGLQGRPTPVNTP